MPPGPSVAAQTNDTAISEAAVADDVARLRATHRQDVPQHTADDPENGQTWVGLTRRAIDAAHVNLERAQLLVVADRSPKV